LNKQAECILRGIVGFASKSSTRKYIKRKGIAGRVFPHIRPLRIYIYVYIYIYATFYKTTPDVSIMQNDWVSHLGAYRFTMRQLPNIKNTPYYRHLREIAAAMPAPKFTFS
jgi:hypothetical protein